MRQLAAALAIPNHVQPGAILHRAARIEKLGFAENLDAREIARDPFQPNQRRVSNELQQVRGDQARIGAGASGPG